MPSSEVDSDVVRLRLFIMLLLLSSLSGGDDDPELHDALLLPGLEPYFHWRTAGREIRISDRHLRAAVADVRCGECGEAESLSRMRAALQSSIDPLSSANINSRSSCEYDGRRFRDLKMDIKTSFGAVLRIEGCGYHNIILAPSGYSGQNVRQMTSQHLSCRVICTLHQIITCTCDCIRI